MRTATAADRRHLSFRAINRRDSPGYDPGLQRHHLLPLQLLSHSGIRRMLDGIGGQRDRFDDFRANGLLLPCEEGAALRLALPMHRGPHRTYSQLVAERIGAIEAEWARTCGADPRGSAVRANMRIQLLQRALRRYLLDAKRRRLKLHRSDTFGGGVDFADLDAMAEALWGATALVSDMSGPGTRHRLLEQQL